MKRKARIVTFCTQGKDIQSSSENKTRLALMQQVAENLAQIPEWHPIDAVLFPGGFLENLPKTAADRFLAKIAAHSPDAHLVVGLDRKGEQLAVAFNRHGAAGRARKIFPVDEDINGDLGTVMTLHEKDFSDKKRLITLANGEKALLCVCYDMFGISDTLRSKQEKLRKAVLVRDANGNLSTSQDKKKTLSRAFDAHRALIEKEHPGLALATIHRFEKQGREIFWQRHGIASASAALGGGLALGAAHIETLPLNPSAMPLASVGVPKNHLESGMQRQAHTAKPLGEKIIHSDKGSGLLRLFQG